MRFFILNILLLWSAFIVSQPQNDNCINSSPICGQNTISGSTSGASVEICGDCADGSSQVGTDCFNYDKTVWYEFTTNNIGGNVLINITNVNCTGAGQGGLSGIIYSAATPCDASTYSTVSNCETNSKVGFTLTGVNLAPNTTYYIQLNSTSTFDCDFDLEMLGTAVQPGQSSISIAANKTTICDGETVTIEAQLENCGNPEIDWFVNGILEVSGLNPFVSNDIQQNDEVFATVTCGCGGNASSNTLRFTVEETSFEADAGLNVGILQGNSIELDATGGITYLWTPGANLSNSNISNPIASPSETTTYTVSITNEDGCQFNDQITVFVIDNLEIPTGFSPNADGVNDIWEIKFSENFPNLKLTVYNRWGQIVYNTIGYTPEKRWNGTRNGNKLPSSTYYYVLDLGINDSQDDIYKGSVSIIY